MKLDELIMFWELKDMVKERNLVSENYVNSWKHTGWQRIYRLRVAPPGKVTWRYADVLYRDTLGKIALIHADCFRQGVNLEDRKSQIEIYIPNAKIKDLVEEFK